MINNNDDAAARAAASIFVPFSRVLDDDELSVCAGSGRRWTTGTVPANAICPVCHVGPRGIGGPDAKIPVRRNGRTVGTVPVHNDYRRMPAEPVSDLAPPSRRVDDERSTLD